MIRILLFVLFSAILVSFLAMLLSRFFIASDSGLAGGAQVLAYGLFGLIGGGVLAFLLRNNLSVAQMNTFNWVLGIGSALAITWLVIRFNTNRSGTDPVDPVPPRTPTQTDESV